MQTPEMQTCSRVGGGGTVALFLCFLLPVTVFILVMATITGVFGGGAAVTTIMHSVELFLSAHPWGTLLLGVALPIVGFIALAIALGGDAEGARQRAELTAASAGLSDVERIWGATQREMRDLHEWVDFEHRLDKLARTVDECAKQIHELHEDAAERMLRRAGNNDPDAAVPPNDPPGGGAPADGPDAAMLFPKPATSTCDGVSRAMH